MPNEYRPVGRTGKLQAAERPLTAMQPPASPTEAKRSRGGDRAKPAFPIDGRPNTADDGLLAPSPAGAGDAPSAGPRSCRSLGDGFIFLYS